MGRKQRGGGHRKPTRTQRRPSLMGTIRLTDAGGMVETAEGSFRVTPRSMREVMNGDEVSVSIHRGPYGKNVATVESVMGRAATTVVGMFEVAGPLGVVRPLDTRLKADFFVLPEDHSPRDRGVAVGDVVLARIVSYPTRMESGIVTIESRLGDASAPDVGIRCVMARYDLTDDYPAPALAEADALELDITQALEDPLRRDIRDRFTLTIDPADARDFDDAISVEPLDEGGYRLAVHIADVSHYVRWGSSLDLAARARGTSVYLADRVLPMLPEHLSCDICSLRPEEDRLAFTVDMDFDARGMVKACRMYPSVIRSRVRLSYDEADALLAGEGDASAPAVSTLAKHVAHAASAGVDLAAFLQAAHELAELRRAVRARRGAVDFDTVEVHAIVGEDGFPTALTCRRRTAATSLIEEAMLVANECVARKLAATDVPAAYRVHDAPTADHLHAAADTLLTLGVVDRVLAEGIALGSQGSMQQALTRAAGTPAEELANALLLRAMQRAVYRPRNQGHYALGATAYCHFTSPIRRYPDLLVHRALKMVLARERLGAQVARSRAPELVGMGREAMENILPALCQTASERERIADAAARASQKVEVALYYRPRVGERARGVITWIDQMGVFVRLDETHAEGLVRMQDVGDEWFDLSERELTLTGASTGRRIRVGERVVVEIAHANPVRGHLDFKLIASAGGRSSAPALH